MNTFTGLLPTNSIFDFVVNATWQIALIYAAAWLMARLLRPLGPRAEHATWVSALFLELLIPACALNPQLLLTRLAALLHPATKPNAEIRILIGPATVVGDLLHIPSLFMQLSLALYLGVTLFFAARLLWGLWRTHQLVQSSSKLLLPAAAPSFWTSFWVRTCESMQLSQREVEIAISPTLRSPMTVGLRRKWLLLPTAFFNQVSDAELEAACAHECAHMHRNDFAKNLFYSVLALPIAFHPLLWRTLAGIRESRELICDDLAAAKLQNHNRYARSLLRLAELLTSTPALREPAATHAIGIFDANNFERRIMRLTHPTIPVSGLRRFATIALCALSATAVCGSALAWRVETNPASIESSGISPVAMNDKMEDPPTRLHVKAGEMQGNLLSQVRPVYPPDAKKAGIQGTVVLQAIIGKDGSVEELKVESGPKELQQSALDAVRQWKYKPYLLNGDPTEVETRISVIYSLGK